MARIALISDNPGDLTKSRSYIIKAFLDRGDEVYALSCDYTEEQMDQLRDLGAKPVAYSLQRSGLNPLHDIKSIYGLIKILKKLNPDITFSYGNKPVIYGLIASRMIKVPKRYSLVTGLGVIYSEIGYNTKRNKLTRILMNTLYRVSLRHGDKIFFQNPDDIELFERKKLLKKGQALLVNGTGVDLNIYNTVADQKDPITFTMATRLLKSKGVYEYIEAARRIRSKFKDQDIRFNLLGRPHESNPDTVPRIQLEEWQKEGIIVWPGSVSNVKDWLEKSSVFVFPSLYREGTPRCVLEAMAMSLPIVTTDMPGCRETVKIGVNGFLVKPQDVDSLTEAMEQFILDPKLISEMGKESRRISVEKYDIHKVNNYMLSVIK
jgi:glycosyltransferase involved in cell wall biosynthesis